MSADDTASPFLGLPTEIYLCIYDHLSTRDLSVLSRTCRTFHNLLLPQLDVLFTADVNSIYGWAVLKNRPRALRRAFLLRHKRLVDKYYVPFIPEIPSHVSFRIPNATSSRGRAEVVRLLVEAWLRPGGCDQFV